MDIEPIAGESETAEQRAQRYLRAVDEVLEISLDSLRMMHQQAKVEVETATRLCEPAPDFTVAVERAARTVRRAILLGLKVAEPVKAPARAAPDRVAARKQIIRDVEDAIDRHAPDEEAEGLRAEFCERLDSPELADDIDQRPVEDIIWEIRRDLGVAAPAGGRPWKRRTPTDVALLCARAATRLPATGPFVLPMPPRGWTYDKPLFGPVLEGGVPWKHAPPIRAP